MNPRLPTPIQSIATDVKSYIRAFEAGRPSTGPKYELAVRFRTLKNGPVVRNRLRLPHPVDDSTRICVICPPGSRHAKAAANAGAVLVGEGEVFEKIKAGKIDFNRCVVHLDSVEALNKAGVGRILGPRGLMPSTRTGTVVKDVASSVKVLVGGSAYRERGGVVRMAIGHLGFGPEMMQRNIRAFIETVKRDCGAVSERMVKEVHEVVLSSSSAPGFSLNGDFRSAASLPTTSLGA